MCCLAGEINIHPLVKMVVTYYLTSVWEVRLGVFLQPKYDFINILVILDGVVNKLNKKSNLNLSGMHYVTVS